MLLLTNMVKSFWKTHEIHKKKVHLDISIMYPLGKEILTNKKQSFQKDFWKQGSISTFQKFIITIWLKFHKNIFHI